MSTLMCIGDAVVDIFVQRQQAFPGGNALNVGVYSTLFQGRSASFTGILGDDQYAAHILQTLEEVGVEAQGVRRACGPTGKAWVRIAEDGDRIFIGGNKGGVQNTLRLRLTDEDKQRVAECGAVHTSVYSNLDKDLPELAAAAEVSYDFSSAPPLQDVSPLAPWITTGFFSADGMPEGQAVEYGRQLLESGMKTVVMTSGAKGSWAMTAEDGLLRQGIVQTEVVDTLGAGDSFISGFLAARDQMEPLQAALQRAAESGARGCSLPGAFGHPLLTSELVPESPR